MRMYPTKVRVALQNISLKAIIFVYNHILKRHRIKSSKVLIVRIDALGDFVIFSPLIKYYKNLFGDKNTYFLLNRKIKQLAQILIHPDQIIEFDDNMFKTSLLYKLKLFFKLYKENYTTTVHPTFSRNIKGDLLVASTCAIRKIGYDGDLVNYQNKTQKMIGSKVYTKIISNKPNTTNEIEINRYFINEIGSTINFDPLPKFEPAHDQILKLKFFLQKTGIRDGQLYVIIHPGASYNFKRWPIQKYITVIDYIINSFGFHCIITGTFGEKFLSQYLDNTNKKIIDLIGKTSIEEMLTLLKGSIFCLSNDTATVHLSSAVGTPVICLMGGGNLRRFFPYGNIHINRIIYDDKAPCQNDNWACLNGSLDKIAPCLQNITTTQVKDEINDLLKYLNKNPHE